MVWQCRRVIARIVGCDDDVALGREQRGERHRLGVAEARHGERAVGGGAVRIEQHGTRAGARSLPKPGGNQQRGGSGRGLAGPAHGLVPDVVHQDVADRRPAEREARAVDSRPRLERGQQVGGRQGRAGGLADYAAGCRAPARTSGGDPMTGGGRAAAATARREEDRARRAASSTGSASCLRPRARGRFPHAHSFQRPVGLRAGRGRCGRRRER